MSRGTRLWESLKTAVIVLLLCSAVVLTLSLISELVTGESLSRRLSIVLGLGEQELPYTPLDKDYSPAALPLAVSMTGEIGRGSSLGDPVRTTELYESLSRQLGEALATATVPIALDWEVCRQLLSGESASLIYPGEEPLSAMAYWLGAEPTDALEGLTASALHLCVDGQRVSLLLRSGSRWLCLGTSLPVESLRQALEQCRPDGSIFALEDESLARLDPLSLLTVSTILPEAQSGNPLADADHIEAVASLLRLNPYRDSTYTSDDGTVNVSGGSGRLRVSVAGELRYTSAGDSLQAASGADADLIESARSLLMGLSDGLTGAGSLQLSALERQGSVVTLRFDYVLAGCRVWQSDGSAAVLRYADGVLQELRWTARCYILTGAEYTLLSARQAAATVGEGALLQPVYWDTGSAVSMGWPKE